MIPIIYMHGSLSGATLSNLKFTQSCLRRKLRKGLRPAYEERRRIIRWTEALKASFSTCHPAEGSRISRGLRAWKDGLHRADRCQRFAQRISARGFLSRSET